jgi:hypothetical protein
VGQSQENKDLEFIIMLDLISSSVKANDGDIARFARYCENEPNQQTEDNIQQQGPSGEERGQS